MYIVQCSVHPHIPVTSSQDLVRRPMRGQDLSGRLYAEHRSCREVIPLGNFTCKCDLSGWNTVNQRSIHHQFNRSGKLHGSWETLLVFWGRARFHGSTVLFWMALVLNTVYLSMCMCMCIHIYIYIYIYIYTYLYTLFFRRNFTATPQWGIKSTFHLNKQVVLRVVYKLGEYQEDLSKTGSQRGIYVIYISGEAFIYIYIYIYIYISAVSLYSILVSL